MGSNSQRNDEIVIDLGELFFHLLSKSFYIIAVGLICGLLAFVGTTLFIPKTYTSTTKMYVLNRQNNDSTTTSNITNSDLQSSTYLTKDYIELIKSRTVMESVIVDLDLDTDYEGILGMTSVSTPNDTRLISISVTDEDPYRARDIANAIRKAAAAHIQRVMDIEAVSNADEANIPDHPAGPNTMRNVLIAFLLGAFLVAAFFTIIFITDDKVSTVDDVENYLGLSVLGTMPLDEKMMKKCNQEKRKKKKNKRNKKK